MAEELLDTEKPYLPCATDCPWHDARWCAPRLRVVGSPVIRPVLICAALAILAASALRAEQPKLAVLEFEVQKGLSLDRRTFSSRLQNAARRMAPHLFVMTQANIEMLVRAAGKKLVDCEGQCAIDTGRLVGADIVIGGRISRVGRLSLSMQMYETKTGQLLAGEDVEARTDAELLDASGGAIERLLRPLARDALPAATPKHKGPTGARVATTKKAANAEPTIQVKRIGDRYSVSIGEGILVDSRTSRWWEKNIGTDATWHGAVGYCKSLIIEGIGKWRLPTRGELATIEQLNDVVARTVAPDAPAMFWSSTEAEYAPGEAYPAPGFMTYEKGSYFHVRCVK